MRQLRWKWPACDIHETASIMSYAISIGSFTTAENWLHFPPNSILIATNFLHHISTFKCVVFFSLTLNMNMKNCTWCLREKKYISKDVESCLSYSYIRAMYAAKKERKNFSSKCLSISEFSWCEPEPSFVPPTEVSKWPVVPVINEMSLLKFNRNANILYITIRNSDNSWVRRFSVAFENATEFLSIGRKAKRK